MPDLLNYRVVATGSAPSPQFTIEALVVDSQTQTHTLKDLTGPRALTWPAAFSALTPDQQEECRQLIAGYLVQCAIKGL